MFDEKYLKIFCSDEILSRTDDENEIDVPVEKIDDPPQDNQRKLKIPKNFLKRWQNCFCVICKKHWNLLLS